MNIPPIPLNKSIAISEHLPDNVAMSIVSSKVENKFRGYIVSKDKNEILYEIDKDFDSGHDALLCLEYLLEQTVIILKTMSN